MKHMVGLSDLSQNVNRGRERETNLSVGLQTEYGMTSGSTKYSVQRCMIPTSGTGGCWYLRACQLVGELW